MPTLTRRNRRWMTKRKRQRQRQTPNRKRKTSVRISNKKCERRGGGGIGDWLRTKWRNTVPFKLQARLALPREDVSDRIFGVDNMRIYDATRQPLYTKEFELLILAMRMLKRCFFKRLSFGHVLFKQQVKNICLYLGWVKFSPNYLPDDNQEYNKNEILNTLADKIAFVLHIEENKDKRELMKNKILQKIPKYIDANHIDTFTTKFNDSYTYYEKAYDESIINSLNPFRQDNNPFPNEIFYSFMNHNYNVKTDYEKESQRKNNLQVSPSQLSSPSDEEFHETKERKEDDDDENEFYDAQEEGP